ncbi:S-adenosylmethionine transporter [Malassezia brasiliensis]|uniref:S-adenosylmethionine transporter n=1 Tax=Malassezia brasiliensis TaxID=1821822 RepID=A0AAF0DTF7_9BASI|nr:S-adenosylmethionine transporter [Malassezia brasiliensis]
MGLGASANAQEARKEGTEHKGKASHAKPSLRSHAASRLERQKHTHEVIESSTDVKRLLWEAQAAFSAHQYTLAAVLYRRAAGLGNDYACAFLAKLFGFGVVRANQSLFLFERDSLRGIAWGIAALERTSQQLQELSTYTADYAAQLSLLNQTLTLLCTLLCSPEACQALATDESQADISFSLLLIFPRSCEVYTARPSDDLQLAEDARRSIWTALRDALRTAQPLFIMPSDAEEPSDSVQLEVAKALARTHVAFLDAFLAMRTAFTEKSTSAVDAVYQAWLAYLGAASDCPDSANLTRYRRVAAEGQQWSAPISERNINALVSSAEHSALSKRISSIFPFVSVAKSPRLCLSAKSPAGSPRPV